MSWVLVPEPSGPPGQIAGLGRRLRCVAGKEIWFDNEGFFWDPNDWSEAAAGILAREAGLEQLDETHWRVIGFLRDFYYTNGRAPLNRLLKEGTGMSLMALEALFPGGIERGARRLAGLPNPKTCASVLLL